MGITKEAIGLAATQQATQPIEERKQPPSQLPSLAFNTLLTINSAIDTAEATAIASKVSAEARLAKNQQDFKRKVDGLITPRMRAYSFMAPQLAGVIQAADTKVEYFAREQELQHQKIRESIFEHDRLSLRSNYSSAKEYTDAIDPIEKDYFGDYEPSPEYKVRKEAEYKTLETYYNRTTEGEKRATNIEYKNRKVEGARNAIGLNHVPLKDATTKLWKTVQEYTKDGSLAYEAVEDLLSSHPDTQGVEEILGRLTYFNQNQKQKIMEGSRSARNQALGLEAGQTYTAITESRDANNSGRHYEGAPTGDPATDQRNKLYETHTIQGPPHQALKDLKEGHITLPPDEIRRYAANYADKARNKLEDLVVQQNILLPAETRSWSAPITPMGWDKTTGSLVGEDANKMDHARVAKFGGFIKAGQGFASEIEDPYTSLQTKQNLDSFKAHKDNPVAQRAMMDNIWDGINEENKKYSAILPQGVFDSGHVMTKNTGSPYAAAYAANESIKKNKGAAIFDQLTLLEKAPGNTLAEDLSAVERHLQNKESVTGSWYRGKRQIDLAHYKKKNPEILDIVGKTTVAEITMKNGGKTAFYDGKPLKPDQFETRVGERLAKSFDFYTGYSPNGMGVPLILPKDEAEDLKERFEIQIKNTNIPGLGNLHNVLNDPKTSRHAHLATHKGHFNLAEIWVAVGNTPAERSQNAKSKIYKRVDVEDKNGVVRPYLINGSPDGLFPERGVVQSK